MTPTALFTDFYELTMMAGYQASGISQEHVTFDMFFRRPPEGVCLLVAAGLEPALRYIESLSFSASDLEFLRSTILDNDFVDSLENFSFTGDVYAMPEGTVCFANEPVVRIEAPLWQAQLIETGLLNAMCFNTLVASNAAEVRRVSGDASIMEFGARRAHGYDGAMTASRAAYLGGCDSTSLVEAAKTYGIPVSGTQAHAWVMAFESELESFREFAKTYPDNCVLLVDTYDTLKSGIPNAIIVAKELRAQGKKLLGVRLDSGNLLHLSKAARVLLDEAGFEDVVIVASGDLDARRIESLRKAGAPIGAFGVGTSLVTAKQDPTISGVYKMAKIGDHQVAKISSTPAKTTSPGKKQVWRTSKGDVIGLADEVREGQPLLELVMKNGKRVVQPPSLRESRDYAIAQRELIYRLSADGFGREYEVRYSKKLATLRRQVLEDLSAN